MAFYICLKTWLCNEYGWVIRVFFYILINYLGSNKKKYLKSKIYGKLTTIKLMILLFRLYLCSIQCFSFLVLLIWWILLYKYRLSSDKIAYNSYIYDKNKYGVRKIHQSNCFLLNMKYLRNIWMLDNDFLAGGMRTNLLGVCLRKCLIFYDYVWFD